MQSRMSKYNTSEHKKLERTVKNTRLYEDVYDDMYRDTTYKNMEIIDSAKEINLNRLKDILDDNYDTRQYRTMGKYAKLEDIDVKPNALKKKNKIYDINEIINEAKNKRSFLEEAKEKQKYMDYAKRNSKYEERYKELKKEEKELEELINTMVVSKNEKDTNDALDLLDLKGNENTIVTNPIETDLNKDVVEDDITKTSTLSSPGKVDKTFYTDSNMFTKNDFEDFTGIRRQLNNKTSKKKVFIILLIVVILLVSAYLIYTNFIK